MRYLLLTLVVLFSLTTQSTFDSKSGAFNTNLPQLAPVHPLLPFTTWDQLKSCSAYFDEQAAVQESLQCANNEIFTKKPYTPLTNIKPPRCFVITQESPDVYKDSGYNYITTSIFLGDHILGFYEDSDQTIYLVETYDVRKVALHEYQHYFLDLAQHDANGRHDHEIWQKCEPPYYQPSEESIAHYKQTGRNFNLKVKSSGVEIFQSLLPPKKTL